MSQILKKKFGQEQPAPAAVPKPPPTAMQTVEQLQEAAAQAKSVADMIAQERKAVEERQEAQRRALEEQKKLAAAETELIRLQLELAGTIPPAEALGYDYAAGADGDKDTSSDSSSEDDEPEQLVVFQRGDGGKVTCCKFAASLLPLKKKFFRYRPKRSPPPGAAARAGTEEPPKRARKRGRSVAATSPRGALRVRALEPEAAEASPQRSRAAEGRRRTMQ